MSIPATNNWPPRFTCNVPGLFESLSNDGYGTVLAPLAAHLNRIARRAIEIEDPVIMGELINMGMVTATEDES